ncbi:MAG: LamG-like jellyroll fold domain-containing protein [Candidatus Woesearchaeota archaeon]
MAGFGTIIAFSLTVFITIGAMIGTITMYSSQVLDQDKIQREGIDRLLSIIEEEIQLEGLVSQYGKLVLEFENAGDRNFQTMSGNSICFDIFIDNNFIVSTHKDYSPVEFLSNTHKILNRERQGRIFISSNVSNSNSILTLISCSGKKYQFELNNLNFKDDNFRRVSRISQSEVGGENIESQIELGSSDIVFSEFDSNIRVFSTLSNIENLILTFDSMSQTGLDDTKTYNFILGSTASFDSNTPTSRKGILLAGLDFEEDQFVTIENFEMNQRTTTSFWFKPKKTLDSSTDAFFFALSDNSNYGIGFNIQETGRVGFYTFDGGGNIEFEIKSKTDKFTGGKWYHVVFVLDNSNEHKVYVNAQEEAFSTQSLSISSQPQNLLIGKIID